MNLLKVNNLNKDFSIESGIFRRRMGAVRALDNVSLSLNPGKVLGVVGESGSGKTTLGKVICRLLSQDSGEVLIEGKNTSSLLRRELADMVQMIFQDPFASLNPKLNVGTILSEALRKEDKNSAKELISETLQTVGLPVNIISSYPHQFSGGQRQRIALARALIRHPKILIADEPLSSLDISIQNQLLNLFVELKSQHQLSFIFISHDLVVTSNLADYLIVMKEGKIIEEGPVGDVISSPKDAYTKNLVSAIPEM